jgi:membrane protein DedA with SNARE-associated domain
LVPRGLFEGAKPCNRARPWWRPSAPECTSCRLELVGHTIEFLVRHGYLLLFFWVLAEQGALPLPSIPLLLACGALANTGKMKLVPIFAYGVAGCLIADFVWFQLGRHRGSKVLRFICRVALEPDSCVRQTEKMFLKYGMRSLLVAKFVPGLNAVAAPLAGSSRASLGRFLLFDSLGSLIWIGSYVLLGYIFTDQLETVADYAIRMGSGVVVLVVGLLAIWLAWKFIQRRRFMKQLAGHRITAEELRDKLEAGEEVVIVDVRSSLAADAASIPGALHIATEELATRHREIARDRDIVLVCS